MKCFATLNFLLTLFFMHFFLTSSALPELPDYLENTIYADNIKTVELYRTGWKLSNPVITLNTDEQLTLSFDDLDGEKKDLYYTIVHCDRNWQVSSIPQEEYLDSFLDFPVTDFEFSINTKVKYVNYMLSFPNEDVPIVLSGNYALLVYDRDYPDQLLFIRRFYVVENIVGISARIRRATHDSQNEGKQEVDFMIKHGNFSINDPNSDIKVVVKQNNREDNKVEDLKPQYYGSGTLEYNYTERNNFKGGNEFRIFEMRSIKYPGEHVQDISLHPPVYHVTLLPDQLRTQGQYNFYEDINGRYMVEAYQQKYPEIEADYMFVHFTLQTGQPFLGGSVHAFGALSNWQCTEQNKMNYNFDSRQYELTMLLKQGYYNYCYAYKDDSTPTVKPEHFEGSHHQTENDYQIFVYYGQIIDRYDRLIGYSRFNSLRNRSYID